MMRFLLFLLGVVLIGAAGVGAAWARDEDSTAAAPVRARIVDREARVDGDHPPASLLDRDPGAAEAADPAPADVAAGAPARGSVSSERLAALAADPTLAPFLPPAEQRTAYRAAIAARDAGRWSDAARTFERAASAGGVLGAVAELRAGQMYARAAVDGPTATRRTQREQALAAFERAAAATPLPATLRVIAHREAADVAAILGRREVARAHLGLVVGAGASTSSQVADALWARAQLARQRGGAWAEDALVAVRTAPGSAAATAALDALEAAAIAVPPQDAAYARYRAWENEAAEERYTAIADAPLDAADAARAWFFLGALAERRADNDEAIDAYRRSLDWQARGPLSDDARWWLGLLYEDTGEALAAAAQFRALAADFPDSPFTAGATVRAGVALAEAGEDADAAAQLRRAMETEAPADAAEAARWLAVFGYAGAGDRAPADYDPTSIAAVLHAGDARRPLPGAALREWSLPAADPAAEEAWMTRTFGRRPTAGTGGALADPDLAAAVALTAAGEEQVARGLLAGVVRRQAGRPWDLLDLARLAERADLHDIGIQAVETLLSGRTPAQRVQVPLAIERYAYPLAYAEPLLGAATDAAVPPLLLAALVRQESAYNRFAGSSAGAMGLTQVIPSTGEEIASELDEPWPADLFDPTRSLRFGATYLATQLERFDGDVMAALAAYNGGPGNAARWQEIQELPGADGYLHAVEFAETRVYLRTVLENYARYRQLYGGATRPALR